MLRLMLALALATIVMLDFAIPAPVQAATYTLEPNANGSSINLNVSGGGSNWAAASASDGSPYVWDNTNAWRIDLYAMSDPPAGTIDSVTVWIRARASATPITQAGAWPSLRTHDATYPIGAATQVTLTTGWADYSSVYAANPYTGSQWTWEEVRDLEAGVRLRRSSNTGVQSQVDHVWLVIDYTPAASAASTAQQVPAFPSIYIGIASALGIGILAYWMRGRLIS